MYKNTSKNMQNIADKANIRTMQTGEQNLTDEEKRDSLKSKLISIDRLILQSAPKSKERRELGLQKHLIQQDIHAIRPKKRCPNVSNYFLEVARERLTKPMYNIIMDEAAKRAREANVNITNQQPL